MNAKEEAALVISIPIAMFVAVLVLCLVAMFKSCSATVDKYNSHQNDRCVEVLREETDEWKGCGRARQCRLDRVTYMCDAGARSRIYLE